MLAIKYWLKNLWSFKALLAAVIFPAILACYFWGMNESTTTMYKRVSSEEVYTIYEGDLACPIAGLVPEKIVEVVENIDGVQLVSPELRQNTILLQGFVPTILGIEPDKFIHLKELIIEPEEWENFKNNPKGVIIGKALAKDLKKQYGKLNNDYRIPLEVEGVYEYPLSLLNNMMLTHKNYLAQYLFKGDHVTLINLKFDPQADPKKISQIIETEINKYHDKANLVCRPETVVWENTREGMAQFAEYVIIHAKVIIGLVVLLYCILAYNFLRKNEQKEKAFLGDSYHGNLFVFRLLYFTVNLLVGIVVGCGLAYAIFISRPSPAGIVDIFRPIVWVTPNIIANVAIGLLLVGIPGGISGIAFYQLFKQKAISPTGLLVLMGLPVLIFVVLFNFYFVYPMKIRLLTLNGGDPDNAVIVQEGSTLRQFSNIPTVVTEFCQLVSGVKTLDNKQLISPVVQLTIFLEDRHVVLLGVNVQTFFDIETKIRFIEGRKPKNRFEIAIGTSISEKVGKQLHLNDTVEYEGEQWRITGIFESDSLYDDYVIAGIDEVNAVTGRETLQFVVLKMNAEEDFPAVQEEIQKYYGMQLDELPDLPRISVFPELKQRENLAKTYTSLFAPSIVISVIALIISFLWFNAGLSSLVTNHLSFIKTGKTTYASKFLSFIAIAGIGYEILARFLGKFFHFTLSFITVNLQSRPPLMLISFLFIMLVALGSVMRSLKVYAKIKS